MKTSAKQRSREDRTRAAAPERRLKSTIEAAGPDHIVQQKRTDTIQNGAYSVAQREKLQRSFGPAAIEPAQREENKTGMPDAVKTQMETAINADFSDVRIHPDSAQAPEVGALAYTQGSDIHFAPGQFSPDTTSGQNLLGHELAHVVQQREGRVQPTTEVGGMPVNDDAVLEKEADAIGSKVDRPPELAQRKPLVGSSDIVQKQSELEEDELMQGKFALQRQLEEEDELMQGKFDSQQSGHSKHPSP